MSASVLCENCKKQADYSCARCGSIYCGADCQIKDWPAHRYICLTMPGLMPIKAPAQPVRESNHVEETIRGFKQNNSNENSSKKYNKPAELQKSVDIAEPDDDCGIDHAAPKSANKSSGRADFEISNNNAHVTSHDVKSRTGSSASNQRAYKNDTSDNKPPTEKPPLKQYQKIESIIRSESPTKDRNSDNIISDSVYTKKPLREGNNIKLVVTDTSTLKYFRFSAMDFDSEDRAELAKNMKFLGKYCKAAASNKKGYAPKEDELCLAMFDEDGEWYRAVVLEKPKAGDKKYTILFIDYGNVCTVSSDNMMPIIKDLMFPALTHNCRIVNIKKGELSAFKAYIDKKSVIDCKVAFNEEQDIYDVAINNIEKVLEQKA